MKYYVSKITACTMDGEKSYKYLVNDSKGKDDTWYTGIKVEMSSTDGSEPKELDGLEVVDLAKKGNLAGVFTDSSRTMIGVLSQRSASLWERVVFEGIYIDCAGFHKFDGTDGWKKLREWYGLVGLDIELCHIVGRETAESKLIDVNDVMYLHEDEVFRCYIPSNEKRLYYNTNIIDYFLLNRDNRHFFLYDKYLMFKSTYCGKSDTLYVYEVDSKFLLEVL